MTFPWRSLVLVLGFAAASLILGWSVEGFDWALRHTYFGIGICIFFLAVFSAGTNIVPRSGDNLLERLQKGSLKNLSFLKIISIILLLFVDLTISVAYWPASLVTSAFMEDPRIFKYSDLQNMFRNIGALRPIVLAVTMLVQNLVLFLMVILLPELKISSPFQLMIKFTMLANIAWLIHVAIYPVEAQMRLVWSSARTFRSFIAFLIILFCSDVILLISFRLFLIPQIPLWGSLR
jgi:hypothetical protein